MRLPAPWCPDGSSGWACRLIEAGKLTPVIDRTYSLSETADAIRYLETGTLAERSSSRPEGKVPE
jgi:hypothetical protein